MWSNVFQCNVFIFENKRQTGYDINIAKIKLFNGTISYDVSNETAAHSEPS